MREGGGGAHSAGGCIRVRRKRQARVSRSGGGLGGGLLAVSLPHFSHFSLFSPLFFPVSLSSLPPQTHIHPLSFSHTHSLSPSLSLFFFSLSLPSSLSPPRPSLLPSLSLSKKKYIWVDVQAEMRAIRYLRSLHQKIVYARSRECEGERD